MKTSLTASHVISDIEFELIQGAISRDELGQSIQAVKQYQNQVRSEVFQSPRQTADTREVLSRQFQINDMLITMLQEMAASLQALQLQFKQLGRARSGVPAATGPAEALPGVSAAEATEQPSWRPTDGLNNAMRLEALHQKLDIQPANVPIPFISGLIRRLRFGLHNLVLFYVNRLGKSQAMINSEYGDWILYLEALQRHQQEEIETLTAQVADLQSRLAAAPNQTSRHI